METLTPLDVIERALLDDESGAAWKTADDIALALVRAGYKIVRSG